MLMSEHPGVRLRPGLEFPEVLDAARRGDSLAYRDLYDALAGRVCGYLAVRGASDPEDLTSEVFLRAFRGMASFEGGERQFRAWVFTIAHNLLLDDRRRRGARVTTRPLEHDAFERMTGGNVEDEAIGNLREDWVSEALARLSPDQQSVLTLRVVGDLSIEQVAKVVGKPVGAVKALQRRGIATLRRHIAGTASEAVGEGTVTR
jgi:RNA polymerase sigma-70 factor (ECF subfamily)